MAGRTEAGPDGINHQSCCFLVPNLTATKRLPVVAHLLLENLVLAATIEGVVLLPLLLLLWVSGKLLYALKACGCPPQVKSYLDVPHPFIRSNKETFKRL